MKGTVPSGQATKNMPQPVSGELAQTALARRVIVRSEKGTGACLSDLCMFVFSTDEIAEV